MVKLIQIVPVGTGYRLKNIFVNPFHVAYMTEDIKMKQNLSEGKIDLDINSNAVFTKIKINQDSGFCDITVMGAPEIVESKMFHKNRKYLLRG